MPLRLRSALVLLGFVAASLGVGALGGLLTAGSLKSWYPGLRLPPLSPPNWVFAPVWTTLYLLIAVAAWLAWRTRPSTCRTSGLHRWWVQLVLNLAWTAVFFGLRAPAVALVDLGLLLAAIVLTMRPFHTISRPAFWLFVPYLAWCSFAFYLNAGIALLNR